MSNNSFTGKNDLAWEKLFAEYKILEEVKKNNFFTIKSSQINKARQARLMTKFDHKKQLPKLFSDNNLAILPLTRGSYLISDIEAYHEFETQKTVIHNVEFLDNIQSIDINNITSESTAINTAYLAGMIEHFSGEKGHLTVSGRMSSGEFSFDILHREESTLSVNIINSQLEIDAGFETNESLLLFEVKNSISDDFLLRQLYYPFRLWEARIQKKIRPIYMIYSNGKFTMYEYEFEQVEYYNSAKLIKKQSYRFEEESITIENIIDIVNKTPIIPEPNNVPFPQADDFNRVVNLCEMLFELKTISHNFITRKHDFDARQTDYYTNAAIYLGLINKYTNEESEVAYRLSDIGNSLINKTIRERNLMFAELILSHDVFRGTLLSYVEKNKMPSREDIVKLMESSKLHNVSAESTFQRRASTIISWINWTLGLIS